MVVRIGLAVCMVATWLMVGRGISIDDIRTRVAGYLGSSDEHKWLFGEPVDVGSSANGEPKDRQEIDIDWSTYRWRDSDRQRWSKWRYSEESAERPEVEVWGFGPSKAEYEVSEGPWSWEIVGGGYDGSTGYCGCRKPLFGAGDYAIAALAVLVIWWRDIVMIVSFAWMMAGSSLSDQLNGLARLQEAEASVWVISGKRVLVVVVPAAMFALHVVLAPLLLWKSGTR